MTEVTITSRWGETGFIGRQEIYNNTHPSVQVRAESNVTSNQRDLVYSISGTTMTYGCNSHNYTFWQQR